MYYGAQAMKRFRHPTALQVLGPEGDAQVQAPAMTRLQAVGSALAFSWLNPHAWLDTAVLIGTASLAYGQGSHVFGLGAIAGSIVWFSLLGVAAFWLGRRLNSLRVWRALDGLVALMMWGTAAWLLSSLF
jgi:L-lysine exporter family protein LysE/ArgO